MILKRSMALLVAALFVVAAGCSSSKGSADGSDTTNPDNNTTTSVRATPSGTAPARDPLPVVRAPDPEAFCTAFIASQDLQNTVNQANFTDNALVLISAPDQLRTQAQVLRVTAPDDLVNDVEIYAANFDQAGNDLQNVTTLRQLRDALMPLNQATSDPGVQTLITWVTKNCSALEASG